MAEDRARAGCVGTKKSYFRALFHRLKARRGTMKAVVAVAASMLRSVYYMLTRGQEYADLGENHFDGLARTKSANRLLKRLKDIGVDVLKIHVREGSVSAIFADVDTLDAAVVADWEGLAGATGLAIVLGADPRSPGLRDHTLPELRLVPTAQREGLVRYAGRGVRVDGELSARIVCDVDAATLSLYVHEPPSDNSERAVPPHLGQQFDVSIDDSWVLR